MASDHPLGTGGGRHRVPNIPRPLRMCLFCRGLEAVEDEIHVLLKCKEDSLGKLRETELLRAPGKLARSSARSTADVPPHAIQGVPGLPSSYRTRQVVQISCIPPDLRIEPHAYFLYSPASTSRRVPLCSMTTRSWHAGIALQRSVITSLRMTMCIYYKPTRCSLVWQADFFVLPRTRRAAACLEPSTSSSRRAASRVFAPLPVA